MHVESFFVFYISLYDCLFTSGVFAPSRSYRLILVVVLTNS